MSELQLETASLSTLHWLGVGLAALSGLIHLVIGLGSVTTALGASFVLAGVGFFGAIGLLLVGYRWRLLYLVGILFVGAQILIYARVTQQLFSSPTEIVDKIAQVVLIGILVVLYRRESRNGPAKEL